MSKCRDIIEQLTDDIEYQVLIGGAIGDVTALERVRRELIALRAFKLEVKESVRMCLFSYDKGDYAYPRGVIKNISIELNKLENKGANDE